MRHFFGMRATVIDITDREVIDYFQEGLHFCRTYEVFSRQCSSSIPKLKEMITSWTNEEDKVITKYESNHGKNNTGNNGNNNNNNSNGNKDQSNRNNNNYSGPNRKCKPDNTVAAMQHPPKDNLRNTSGTMSFKDLLKEWCSWHPDKNHTTEQCFQLRRTLKDVPEPQNPHEWKGKAKQGDNDF